MNEIDSQVPVALKMVAMKTFLKGNST